MLDSIRTRLTFWYIGVLALVLVVFSIGVYLLFAHNQYHRVDTELQLSVEGTAGLLASEIAENETKIAESESEVAEGETEPGNEEIESVVEMAQGVLTDRYFPHQSAAILDGDGRLIAEQVARGGESLRYPVPISSFTEQVNFYTQAENRAIGDDERRAAFQRVTAPPSGTTYLIVVSQSLKPVSEELEKLRDIFYIAVPAILILAGLGGSFLARKSLAPVVKMSDAARRLGAENLEQRLPVANPNDELGQLALTFNELLSRLNTAFAQQRQFMADASHELRTPLSVLRTTAQVTLEKARRDEGEYRDAIRIMDEQTERLARIVEDMFTLARADAGRRELQQISFYLDELMAETARAASVLATPRGVEVSLVQAAETPYFGDEGLLRQMILNLLDNAIRHSPTRGTVSLQLSKQDSAYLITVADHGSGIPAEAQTRIFERFYRIDQARSRAEENNGGGAGLGLSIAQWIARAHGGSLTLQRSDQTGSVFVARLPVRNRVS